MEEQPEQPRPPAELPRDVPVEPAEASDPAGPRLLTRERPGPPEPGTLGSAVPPFFHLALFALTFASALLAGLTFEDAIPEGATLVPALWRALAFAASLMAILLSHEMGHFLFARRHKVDASWPFFLPAPLLSFIGTFGAVIRLRSHPRTRNALVDIGAAGPIFGFLVTIPVLFLGLRLSHLAPAQPMQPWTLWDALVTWSRTGDFPELRDAVGFGEPLLLQLMERQRFGVVAANMDIALHPVALAGWFGLFVTALNLLPLGQLDGGHILYAISSKLHRALGPPLSAILVGLGVFTPFVGWLIWGLLSGTVLSRHPPLRDPLEPMSRARQAVAIVSLIIFVLSFCPVPLAMLTA